MNLKQVKSYEYKSEQKTAKRKIDAKWRMYERQKKQNEEFVWSPGNVAKIIRLNDRLWTLMQEADRIGKSIYSDIQKLIDEGKNYYDKDFNVEVSIHYDVEMMEDHDDDIALYDSVKSWTGQNGFDLMNDKHNGKPLNWNINEFNRPELDGHYICYMMHWYFHEGLYSLQDAVTMDPEKFYIYTTIYN
jgi:hypothetical protein